MAISADRFDQRIIKKQIKAKQIFQKNVHRRRTRK